MCIKKFSKSPIKYEIFQVQLFEKNGFLSKKTCRSAERVKSCNQNQSNISDLWSNMTHILTSSFWGLVINLYKKQCFTRVLFSNYQSMVMKYLKYQQSRCRGMMKKRDVLRYKISAPIKSKKITSITCIRSHIGPLTQKLWYVFLSALNL